MIIPLKKEHFDVSEFGLLITNYLDSDDCPLARAIKDVLGENTEVLVHQGFRTIGTKVIINGENFITEEPWDYEVVLRMYLTTFKPITLIKLV